MHGPTNRSPTDPILTVVIDDDSLVLQSTVAALDALGCRCVGFSTWEPAIKHLLDAGNVQLIITDLQMPDVNGFAILDHIRKLPLTPPPLVAASSGHHDSETLSRIESAGFDWHLAKPHTLRTLRGLLTHVRASFDRIAVIERQEDLETRTDPEL